MTERASSIVLRPDPAQLRFRVALIGLALPIWLLVWWGDVWPGLRDLRENASDPRYLLTLLLIGGPPAGWLLAYLVGLWLRARLEVDARSLRVTGSLGPTRTVARNRLGSIVRCAVPGGFWGTPMPRAFLLDRSSRYVLELSTTFDLDRVAAVLAVPLTGTFDNKTTRAEAEAKYGSIFPRDWRKLAAVALIGVAYTVAAIAFLILTLP